MYTNLASNLVTEVATDTSAAPPATGSNFNILTEASDNVVTEAGDAVIQEEAP